ncbi:MAG: HlyD family type I secretion periplasmic adaptor subunit [Candidatus Nitrohelix vancouverensis]|uniref:HlyD family type I secretion periplasmic adaptor subunit n=1 Tax=Candidatus Nitrohelix vancouverensis TaxID=2705534 RepID=A0A7T0C134_9BACT|nr:MAG: HlyD family type I secretion periplasmic adaptor subunit [Candidatus Nitrohelix vancouverensis]
MQGQTQRNTKRIYPKSLSSFITLDNTLIQADASQFRQRLETLQLQQTRQEAFQRLLQQREIPPNWQGEYFKLFHDVPDSVKMKDIATQQNLFIEQVNEYLFRKQGLEREWDKRSAERDRAMTSVLKLQGTLPLITERTQSYKTLMEQEITSRHQYLEMEQQRIQQEQDLAGYRAQVHELSASISAITAQLDTLKAEVQKNNLQELSETNQQIDAVTQEIVKTRQRNKQQVLVSPIDGAVQQLAIHTVGGVVTPAQELMQIVPESTELEVEAFVLNKDIGFVEEGQEAEVKIDTFDFTKYGFIEGTIIDLSNDAIADENLGLIYQCRVLIKKTKIQINDKWVNLGPGMSVMVEIKTGKRKLIEYFLSPLLRYKQEAIRER